MYSATTLQVNILAASVVAMLLAVNAAAQVTVSPAAPTSNDVIVAEVQVPGLCETELVTTISGNVVQTRVAVSNCFGGPPAFSIGKLTEFGPLAPGSYSYEVYFDYDDAPSELVHEGTVVVLPALVSATVPALGPEALALLAAAVMLAGLLSIRRLS
jgi:hypothetical protein